MNRNIVLLLALVLLVALCAPALADSQPWRKADLFAVRSVPMVEGWNLVGWTGDEVLVEDALASIAGKYDQVYGYDAFDDNPWRIYDLTLAQERPDFLRTLWTMQRGRGYWVRCVEPCVWELP